MTTDVLVPPLGQTVDTVTLASWYKREGESIKQGEPLFAIETDKATLDIEAPASGILRGIQAQAGDEVKVLSAIAVIAQPGEDLPAPALPAAAQPSPKSPVVPARQSQPGAAPQRQRIFASPRARQLARQEGVTLEEVTATGPEGAIIERDVRAYLAQTGAPAVTWPAAWQRQPAWTGGTCPAAVPVDGAAPVDG
jgi:pyruvate dehydrogenase E2 component (dihydrolipoamide acetyltransferase)